MVHEISRREVLNNLIQFKDNLLEMRGEEGRHRDQEQEKEEKGRKKGERAYKVLLNRKTGDMRFAQKISSLEHHIGRKRSKKEAAEDWKEIHIVVQQKSPRDAVHFEVRDADEQSLKSQPSDLDPLAWKVASETVDILNQRAKEVKGHHIEMLPEEVVLRDLSSIRFALQRIEDLPGWMGSLSRIEAEEKLMGKPVGTYLLREGDEVTISMALHFSEENLLSIHAYLLTVVEEGQKVADILLLHTDRGWTQYFDDPNLNDPKIYHYYPSPQAILHSLSSVAKNPIS